VNEVKLGPGKKIGIRAEWERSLDMMDGDDGGDVVEGWCFIAGVWLIMAVRLFGEGAHRQIPMMA
jgi:hypothetical protein